MAVSVDTVYQRVLTLANKEQRGYITPQEFNLLANQAQMQIFEQYFYDINQFGKAPGNNNEYSDPLVILDEKISLFEQNRDNSWISSNMYNAGDDFLTVIDAIYRIGTIKVGESQVNILNSKDFESARISRLTSPTLSLPIGHYRNKNSGFSGRQLYISVDQTGYATPGDPEEMSIRYIQKPEKVEWAYVVINDKPLYNDNMSMDFKLHQAEETELVYKILKLAGINLKAQEIVQVGQTLEAEQIQQEKQ